MCKLQGKAITKEGFSRKTAAPVSSGQFPRQSRRADLPSDPMEGTYVSYLQEVSNKIQTHAYCMNPFVHNEYSDQD